MNTLKQILLLHIFVFLVMTEIFSQEEKESKLKLKFGPQFTKESLILGTADDNAYLENSMGFEVGLDYSLNMKNRLWKSF